MQGLGRRVGDDPHAATPEALRLVHLDCHDDQRLLAPLAAASQTGLRSTEERLIHLDSARQPLAARPDEHRAQAVEDRPPRLVGAELEGPLQALR